MEAVKNLNFLETLLAFVIIVFIIGIGVVLLNLHFQKNLSAQKLQQEALKGLHQQDLLRSSIHAQEEERKRIAQDLHDELGAVLSIMRMHLVMLEQQGTGDAAQLLSKLKNTRELSETALAGIRSISHQLMPPQLEAFGLIKTLESVTEQINKTGEITIQLTAASAVTNLAWEVNLGLYRIIMELINNTIKHAGAGLVIIDLCCDNRYIACHYTDDGKGLPGDSMHSGLGLKSIEGRVSSLGGTFRFGNREEGGFSAAIQLPAGMLPPAASKE
jgi:signal transduction histidine kinase